MGDLLFGYRHVDGVPLCPCRDPGNYMLCEQGEDRLSFVLRCWCGSSLRGTWDSEQERRTFLDNHGYDGDTGHAPTEVDIELDEDGGLSDGNHDDIAHEAGYLSDDDYEAANERSANGSPSESGQS